MNEDDLRAAFHRTVERTSAPRDLLHRAQLAAAERRRHRDMVRVAVGTATLSVLVVVGAFAVGGTGKTSSPARRVSLADNSKVESTQSESPASALASGRPRQLVGASVAGRLVTINGSSGQTERVLTVIHDPADGTKGGLLGHVTLTPDGGAVYFDVKTGSDCQSEVRTVSASGGVVTDVVAGSVPAVDPAGNQLAFVRQTSCNDLAVVVRSLRDGTERVIATRAASGPTSIAALSWSPVGGQLIADLRFDDPIANRLAFLDSRTTVSLGQATALRPPLQSKTGTVFEYPTLLPDGNVFLSERCCVTDPAGSATQESRLLVVDTDGKLQSIVAYGFLDRSHGFTAVDSTGDHLLYMSGTDLMASDGRARPTPLARGLLGAAWR